MQEKSLIYFSSFIFLIISSFKFSNLVVRIPEIINPPTAHTGRHTMIQVIHVGIVSGHEEA